MPLLLAFPVGAEAEVEVLPGEVRSTFRAAQWFAGERPFPGPDDEDYLREISADWLYSTGSPLAVYRDHDAALAREAIASRRARKALRNLQDNPRHPGLHSHPYESFPVDRDVKVWDSYVENNTPSAWRIFWRYGPDEPDSKVITVLAITPHP